MRTYSQFRQHPTGDSKLLACHDCDTLFSAPAMRERERLICPNCGASLFTFKHNSLHRAAAYIVAAGVLFIFANAFPFMTLKQEYRFNNMILAQSVSGLWEQNYQYLAAAVAVVTLVAPTVLILGLMYLLFPLFNQHRLPGAIGLCRWVSRARRWNMIDVYLLGVLVSLLKLGKLATLTLGISFWAFVGLIVCLTLALSSIDYRELWLRLGEAK